MRDLKKHEVNSILDNLELLNSLFLNEPKKFCQILQDITQYLPEYKKDELINMLSDKALSSNKGDGFNDYYSLIGLMIIGDKAYEELEKLWTISGAYRDKDKIYPGYEDVEAIEELFGVLYLIFDYLDSKNSSNPEIREKGFDSLINYIKEVGKFLNPIIVLNNLPKDDLLEYIEFLFEKLQTVSEFQEKYYEILEIILFYIIGLKNIDLDEIFRKIVDCYKKWDTTPPSNNRSYLHSKIYNTYISIIFTIYYNFHKMNRKTAYQKLKDFLLEIIDNYPPMFKSLLARIKGMIDDQQFLVETFYLNPNVLCDPDIINIFINVTEQILESRDQGLITRFLGTNCLIEFYEDELFKIFYPLELEDYIYIIISFRKFYIEKNYNFFENSPDYDVFDYVFRIIFKVIDKQELNRKENLYIGIMEFVKNKCPEFSQYIEK